MPDKETTDTNLDKGNEDGVQERPLGREAKKYREELRPKYIEIVYKFKDNVVCCRRRSMRGGLLDSTNNLPSQIVLGQSKSGRDEYTRRRRGQGLC